MYYRLGVSLYLAGTEADAARTEQENHRETSVREGVILDYLSRKVPENWNKMTLDARRLFLGGNVREEVSLAERDRICALEVWCEALGGDIKGMRRQDAIEINSIIASARGWKKQNQAIRFGYAGVQKGFFREKDAVT